MASRRRGQSLWQPTFNPCDVQSNPSPPVSPRICRRNSGELSAKGAQSFNINPTRTAVTQDFPRPGKRIADCLYHPGSPLGNSRGVSECISPARATTWWPEVERREFPRPVRRTPPRGRSLSPFGTSETRMPDGDRPMLFDASGKATLRALDSTNAMDVEKKQLAERRSCSAPHHLAWQPCSPFRHPPPSPSNRNPMTGAGIYSPCSPKKRSISAHRSSSLDFFGSEPAVDLTARYSGRNRRYRNQPERVAAGEGKTAASPSRRSLGAPSMDQALDSFYGSGIHWQGGERKPTPSRRQQYPDVGMRNTAPYADDAAHAVSRTEKRQAPIGRATTWLSRVKYQKRKYDAPRTAMDGNLARHRGPVSARAAVAPPSRHSCYRGSPKISPQNFLYGGVGEEAKTGGRKPSAAQQKEKKPWTW